MMKYTYLLILFLTYSNSFAQKLDNKSAKAILQRVAQNYLVDNYSLNYKKTIYRSVEDSSPMEVSLGVFFVGKKNEYRIEEPGTIVIQNDDLNMTIDSSSNMIYISELDEDYIPLEMGSFMTDSVMNNYNFSLVKKKDVHEFIIENKLELSHSIVIFIEPVSYEVREFFYYMPTGNYFSETLDDETVESPVMRITYDKIKKEKFNPTFFSQEKWLVKDKMPVELRKEVTQFRINDLRVKSHFN